MVSLLHGHTSPMVSDDLAGGIGQCCPPRDYPVGATTVILEVLLR